MKNWQEIYQRKRISLEEALTHIKSNDVIVSALCATEPQGFLSQLHTMAPQVENVEVYMCLPLKDYPFFTDPSYAQSFQLISWFHSPGIRKINASGRNIPYQPNHLYLAYSDLSSWRKIDVFVGSCTPPDKSGHVSLSCSLPYEREALENAKLVILEVNENLPRTLGDTHVRVDQADFFYENHAPIPSIPTLPPTEKDLLIGNYCADLIEDGSTLQIGIGGIPSACSMALIDRKKKHLGVHSEMLVDAMVDLYEAGVIDNSHKTLYKNKFIASFALGSNKLYDFIHDNPAVEIHRGCWVVDPAVLRRNHKMVSINTCIMVDLSGQVASETIGPVQYSGTGGQFATHTGAREGKGGKGILTCYATGGKDGRHSSIVPLLPQGSAVTTHRSTVDYVVTEYGVAALRGRDVKRRALALIDVAHPQIRPKLREQAKKYNFI